MQVSQVTFADRAPYQVREEITYSNIQLAAGDDVVFIGGRAHTVFTRRLTDGRAMTFSEPMECDKSF